MNLCAAFGPWLYKSDTAVHLTGYQANKDLSMRLKQLDYQLKGGPERFNYLCG